MEKDGNMSSANAQMSVTDRGFRTRPQRRRGLSDRAIVNLFIWPTLILLIAMNIFPLFYSLYLGFTDYSAIARQQPVWVAFENFANILNDERMWKYFVSCPLYFIDFIVVKNTFGAANLYMVGI